MATDLAGLPPLSICSVEFDPLRDEAELFARRAIAAGVPVQLRRYEGMLHGFVGLPQMTPMAHRAIDDLATDLKAALA